MEVINYRSYEEELHSEGRLVTVLNGNSMFPMVHHGKDPVLIVPPDRPLKKYDVAVYRLQDRYIVHRVLGCGKDCFVIRGDNCTMKEHVPWEAVAGVVAGFWRNGHYISVTNLWYRIYARVWVAVNPLVCVHHFIGRCFRFIRRRVSRD